VYFFLSDGDGLVTVIANISGIHVGNTTELHGMHIHEFGDLSNNISDSAGSHYKGYGSGVHGCPSNTSRDSGDMGNWVVNADGTIVGNKTLDLIDLTGGLSVIGRAVVLHLKTDDCVNISSASSRIAHCVIGVGNKAYFPPILGSVVSNIASNVGTNAGTKAVCVLSTNNITGSIVFEQGASSVSVTARINGLTFNTTHGLHIHEFGDLSSPDGLSLGSHYNPYNYNHSLPPQPARHFGDLGNICTFSPNGVAYYKYFTNNITVNASMNNIIGRGVVIHAIRDDGSTNYGARIGLCVIGIANSKFTSTYVFEDDCCSNPSCLTPLILSGGADSSTISSTLTGMPSTSGPVSTGNIPANNTNSSRAAVIAVSILVPLLVITMFLVGVFLYLRQKRKAQDDRFKVLLDDNERE